MKGESARSEEPQPSTSGASDEIHEISDENVREAGTREETSTAETTEDETQETSLDNLVCL